MIDNLNNFLHGFTSRGIKWFKGNSVAVKEGKPIKTEQEMSPGRIVAYALQNVMVMAISPIAAVLLISQPLGISSKDTVSLISSTFLICGIGTIIQSIGFKDIGAKLPLVVVPGGGAVAIFLLIAQKTNLQTAAGSVLIAALFDLAILPFFKRIIFLFSKLVIGTNLVVISITLISMFSKMLGGDPGTRNYGNLMNVMLGVVTIISTLVYARYLPKKIRQLSVLIGMVTGIIISLFIGNFWQENILSNTFIIEPRIMPYGFPEFNIIAAFPMVIFSIVLMVEATGQTEAITEAANLRHDLQISAPKTIRGDVLTSVIGALFGTTLVITSSENIGIVKATKITSRHVTALAGFFLIIIGLFGPAMHVISMIPVEIISATAILVFSLIGVMGIEMINKYNLNANNNFFVVGGGLVFGLVPLFSEGIFRILPFHLNDIFGNGIAASFVAAVVLNYIFNFI